MYEIGLTSRDRCDQGGNELWPVAAVTVEKQHDAGVGPGGGDAALKGSAVATSRLHYDPRASRRGSLGRAVAGSAVDDNHLGNPLGAHGGDHVEDRFLLVETRNDDGHDRTRRRPSGVRQHCS